MQTVYYTATSLDGFIATSDHSLEWLLARDIDPDGPLGWNVFRARVGAAAYGANTYQWVLDHAPDGWDDQLPAWVLSHRVFPPRAGVVVTDADVRAVHAQMAERAAGKDVWIVGGGDLAGQFADAGLLDEVLVSVAPVVLGRGARLLPRRLELRLEEVGRNREFACLRYSVVRG